MLMIYLKLIFRGSFSPLPQMYYWNWQRIGRGINSLDVTILPHNDLESSGILFNYDRPFFIFFYGPRRSLGIAIMP